MYTMYFRFLYQLNWRSEILLKVALVIHNINLYAINNYVKNNNKLMLFY